MVRFKNRYIVIEVNPVEKLKKGINLRSSLLYNSVITAVQKFHGDFGVAAIRAGLSAKYCNEVTRTALIRLRHGPHRLLSSILPLVNEIGYQKVQVKTLYVGATLKQCYKFLRNYQKQMLMKIWRSLETKELQTQMEESIMDLTPVINFDERTFKSKEE
uniref:Ribonuclease P/MRP protein subunit POP5 n=1 Tax=Clastoptera arizonana TaxID=38151 RepID=A0A1B6DKF7_9HEMI